MIKIWSLATILLTLLLMPAASAATIEVDHIHEIMRGNIIDLNVQITPESELMPLTGIEILINEQICGVDLNENSTCEFLTINQIEQFTTNQGVREITGLDGNNTNQTHTFTNGTGINSTIQFKLRLDTETQGQETIIQATALLEDETTTARIYSRESTLTITPEPLIAHLQVHQNYPRNGEVVVICASNHATTYDWDFGDGDKFYDIQNNNVFHRYSKDGRYTVTCGATHEQETVFSSITLDIANTPQLEMDVDVNGASAKITCQESNFETDSIDFDFGEKFYWDVSSNSQTHTYQKSGSYIVSCTASEGNIQKVEYTQIEITIPQQIEPEVQAKNSFENWADGSFDIIEQKANPQVEPKQEENKQVVLRPSKNVEENEDSPIVIEQSEESQFYGASMGGASHSNPINPLVALMLVAAIIAIVIAVSITRGNSDEFFGLN